MPLPAAAPAPAPAAAAARATAERSTRHCRQRRLVGPTRIGSWRSTARRPRSRSRNASTRCVGSGFGRLSGEGRRRGGEGRARSPPLLLRGRARETDRLHSPSLPLSFSACARLTLARPALCPLPAPDSSRKSTTRTSGPATRTRRQSTSRFPRLTTRLGARQSGVSPPLLPVFLW